MLDACVALAAGACVMFAVLTAKRTRPTSEAEQKAQALLRAWLTPEQARRYDSQKHFEVIGSDTGRRYRIRHGCVMNVDQLDAAGKKVCGWCFMPEGELAAGDCMLAQKIALETFETKVLAIGKGMFGNPRLRLHCLPAVPDISAGERPVRRQVRGQTWRPNAIQLEPFGSRVISELPPIISITVRKINV